MDIQVARFRQTLELLKPVIPRKPTLPILTNVLLRDGKAMATDMETMVIVRVPEADIDCLLPYSDVVKMIQYVPGMETLHIEATDGRMKMSWSDGSSTFGTKKPADFPLMPEFVPVAEAPIDIDILIPAMYEVLAFSATETDRPVLNGVTLVMGEEIAVAAGTGFQMAYKPLPLSFPQESIVIVPQSSVAALKLLWAKTPRTPPASDSLIPILMAKKQATVALNSERGLRFVFGDETTAIVKLVDGDPPAWLKLMPKEDPVMQATVMAPDLALAVRRVLTVALEGSKIVRLEFDEGSAKISAIYGDQEAESAVRVLTLQGAPNKVGLNASFLLDYLKGKDGLVTISWVSEGTPVAFKHQKSPMVLIMPMKVDWENTQPATEPEQAEPEAEAEAEPEAETEPEAEPGGKIEAEAKNPKPKKQRGKKQ